LAEKLAKTVDERMAKASGAAEGEANLRRHRSTTWSATLDLETQGQVAGKGNAVTDDISA
jgi:hypothetical protein